MRGWIIWSIVLFAAVAMAAGRETPQPVSYWADEEVGARGSIRVDLPTSRQLTTVRIDTMASYIRYVYHPKQAVILPDGGDYWFFFAYNDAYSHVRTKIFEEAQLGDPGTWVVEDVYEWTGAGELRYISPTAYYESGVWYPELTFNCYSPPYTAHMIDPGGLGVGLWTPPMDVLGPIYDYYLPLTEAGPDSIVYMDAQARDIASDSHIFKSFNGFTGDLEDPPGEVMIFPANVVYGQGYENSQLLYRNGKIVIVAGAYRGPAYTDPNNPLLVVYQKSTDGGNTWSDTIWVDQTLVADMPGSTPGINGHWSVSFFDGLIDPDGDLHFMCAIADSGCYNNVSYVHGMYDIHQDDGSWIASLVTDGVYAFNPDSTFDPRSDFLDGDTWMHSPSLAEASNGDLVAAWNDIGYFDIGRSTFDIWYSRSTDGGNTWSKALKVTETRDLDEWHSRLLPTTTEDNAYILSMYGSWENSPLDMIQIPLDFGIDPNLSGELLAGDLRLTWTGVEGAAAYWVYGAPNDAHFVPAAENKLAHVPPWMTTWSSSNGVGDPDTNWTYLVVAVDASDQEIGRSNRIGEHDFEEDIP